MIFFNETYILAIIAAAAIFWLLVPKRFRTHYIIAASFGSLLSIQPVFSGILIGLIVVVFFIARLIENREQGKGRALLAGILLLVTFLLIAKYAGFLYGALFTAENDFSKNYLVPLGVSYLCFKLIAFVIDVYRGVIIKPGLMDLPAFIFFIPTFPAGPIERFQDFVGKRRSDFDADFCVEGLRRLALGYFKKVVLVNYLLNETLLKVIKPQILANDVSLDLGAGMIILFLVGLLVYAYLDLSAYADIAIGYSRLFGYEICENMNYPIFQSNLSDYWNRWHISLSSWCRNNVYFPVLGMTRNISMALMSSFIVMGLWHNISLNWLAWGIWHATGLIVYSKWSRFTRKMKKKYKRKHKKVMPSMPAPVSYALGMTLTCLWAAGGYAFVMLDRSGQGLEPITKALRLLLAIFL